MSAAFEVRKGRWEKEARDRETGSPSEPNLKSVVTGSPYMERRQGLKALFNSVSLKETFMFESKGKEISIRKIDAMGKERDE